MTIASGVASCESPSGESVCPHVRRWGEVADGVRGYVCVRDGERREWVLHVDPVRDELVARPGCGGFTSML